MHAILHKIRQHPFLQGTFSVVLVELLYLLLRIVLPDVVAALASYAVGFVIAHFFLGFQARYVVIGILVSFVIGLVLVVAAFAAVVAAGGA